jgi:hypothetical protein
VENENENDKGKGKGKEKENMNLLIFVAVVLDSRYKLSEYTELVIQEIYGEGPGQKLWAALNKCLHHNNNPGYSRRPGTDGIYSKTDGI